MRFRVTRWCKNQHLGLTFWSSVRHVESLAGNERSLPVTSVREQMETECVRRRRAFHSAIRRMSAALFGWALQEAGPAALLQAWGRVMTVIERGRISFKESNYRKGQWHNRSIREPLCVWVGFLHLLWVYRLAQKHWRRAIMQRTSVPMGTMQY